MSHQKIKLAFAITLGLLVAHLQPHSAKPIVLVQNLTLSLSQQLKEPCILDTPPPPPPDTGKPGRRTDTGSRLTPLISGI
ncbi:MAG: hypothetical protein PUP92_06230 [Rhizonema sp. PD38]|nr:hypothetical protein [Rhizonema sp. PD38]